MEITVAIVYNRYLELQNISLISKKPTQIKLMSLLNWIRLVERCCLLNQVCFPLSLLLCWLLATTEVHKQGAVFPTEYIVGTQWEHFGYDGIEVKLFVIYFHKLLPVFFSDRGNLLFSENIWGILLGYATWWNSARFIVEYYWLSCFVRWAGPNFARIFLVVNIK